MQDLISRADVIELVKNSYYNLAESMEDTWAMVADVEKLPSAQPEIIRCKDCRFYQDNNGGYPHMNCKWDANETPDEDDFCSGAERRTDGTD